jgi:membrane protease YdiL (CAAX protease family)
MIGFALGALIVASMFLTAVLWLGRSTGLLPDESTAPAVIAVQLVGQAIGFLLVCGVYLIYMRVPVVTGLRLRSPSLRQLMGSIGVGLGLVGLIVGIEAGAELVPGVSEPADHALTAAVETDPTVLLVLIGLSPVVLIPAEEVLFRGIIQTRLKGVASPRTAILLTAVIFFAIHLPAFVGSGAILSGAFVFVSGILLGWTLEWADSLVAPICAHSIYNGVVFAVAYL